MEGQKRLRRNKGRHSKLSKKMPFLGGKLVFSLRSKERKEKTTEKNNKKIKKTNKENVKIHKNTKTTFSYQSKFSFLGGCPKIPFLTTWPRKRAPPKHYTK